MPAARSTFAARAPIALVLLLALVTVALSQVEVPPLRARVTDLTSTLTAQQRDALERKLQAFETRKGSQVGVLIVPSTDPEDIAEFGIRVAEAWKLGREGTDDGAILIVAKDDRRLRIEVGYGVEPVLTDAASRRIIDEIIVPRFRQGDYYGGIDAGLDRMMRIMDGEPLPAPQTEWRRGTGLGHFLPLLFLVFLMPAILLRRLFGRFGGALTTAGIGGFVTWLLTHLLGISITVGVVGFVAALLLGGFGGPRGWSGSGRGRRTYGGWAPGGIGWGGGGRRGGFGGGFRGGGGGFGGGGASGGW